MFRHRILLIIYPAQGHIHPAFQFAKKLVTLGAHVTVSTTLHMHRRITNKPTLSNLSFLPFSDGFDDGYSGTDFSLYTSEFKRLGSEFVTNLIHSKAQEGHPLTCIVHTPLLSWAADLAREFHLPTALLWTQPATILDIYYFYFHGYGDYMDEKIKCDVNSCSIELPGLPFMLEPRDLPSFLLRLNPTMDSFILPMFEQQILALDVETKSRILVNSFEALETEALRLVQNFNMIPIGPLIPSALLDGKDVTDTSFGGDIFQGENGYVEWLDSKEEKSVVYVSFGSFCALSKTQKEELARALLDCGSPFLWVIRENDKKSRVEGKVKEEEEEEISCREELEQRGKIVKWCSQVEVLSHGSVGCFVTHCGWNSSVESLASGIPMVAFPQFLEQKTNAKLIEDVWKIGVRVDTRKNKEGIVEGRDIRECLEVVMGSGEKGVELRNNAKKWKDLAREAVKEGGSSDKNLRTFLDGV